MTEAAVGNESGDHPSLEDQQIPTEVEVDGQKVNVQQAIDDHLNKKEWQKAQTQRDQEIAEQRKQITGIIDKVIDKTNQSEPVAVAPQKPSFDLDARMNQLPDPIEDEKGYRNGMAQVMKEYGESLKSDVEASTQKLREESKNQIASQSQADRIVQDNLRMVDDYIAKNLGEVTAQEKADIVERVGQKWGNTYGSEDSSGAFRYNESAGEESLWQVPSVRNRLVSKETNQARNEGLRGRQAGQTGQSSTGRVNSPASNAPMSEKVEYLRGLSERDAQLAIGSMSTQDKDAMMTALYE